MDGLDGRLSLHQLLPCQAQLRLPQGVGGWEGEGAQRVGQGRGTDGVWGRGGGARVGVHAGAGRVNGHGQCTWQRRELERRPGGHREGCPAHSPQLAGLHKAYPARPPAHPTHLAGASPSRAPTPHQPTHAPHAWRAPPPAACHSDVRTHTGSSWLPACLMPSLSHVAGPSLPLPTWLASASPPRSLPTHLAGPRLLQLPLQLSLVRLPSLRHHRQAGQVLQAGRQGGRGGHL